MDVIEIRDLRVETRIGWSDEERATPRPVTINIAIETDARAAGTSDDLAATVDYGAVTVAVADLVRRAETRLLEALAEQIAGRVAVLEGVSSVTVEVEKDDPPIDEDVRAVAVRVRRPRSGGA